MYCCTLLYVHSSIAIILMGKRELIALLNLSSWCLVMVERLFLAVPWGSLQLVIVVFPDHTHLFLNPPNTKIKAAKESAATQKQRKTKKLGNTEGTHIQDHPGSGAAFGIAGVTLPPGNYQEVRKVAKIRNQYNQVSLLTQDITWESDKNTIKHHKQKPRGQPFPVR